MPSFDSIIIGEDWISEHYFTTDSVKESFQGRVLELRKHWDTEAKEERSTVRRAFAAAAGQLQVLLATLVEDPSNGPSAHQMVRTVFGYPAELVEFHGERSGAELTVPEARVAGLDSVLILQAEPVDSIEALLDPETGRLLAAATEENKPLGAVSKVVSAIFRCDSPPPFMLVQAGRWVLLAEKQRWAEGRYLAVDLLVVSERRHEARGGEVDRAVAILGSQALTPTADGTIWWTAALDDSVKHTVGVSKDLREGIRLSIEIIANDVVRRRAERNLPLAEINGQDLAQQSLRFLYRILFLLYAEASPEMKVLPSGAPEYESGYGLDRLRELTLTELVSARAQSGTHLYLSLAKLFELVDRGHTPSEVEQADDPAPGLQFNSLRADLFSPKATALIDQVGLANEAVQKVLEHLLLSKESKGRKGADRGFISYAELGINQLGAVYEGLMSYTGFFAGTDLYEVAKGGDPEKGSWVIPTDRADHLSPNDFVRVEDPITGEPRPVVHYQGTFVFRLAGRERQQSASYYTPEVLTKFVVSQSLAELLDQDGERTTPEHILEMTICEPALGSGAFAIEAVRQLAAEYLKRKQEDLDQLIDADQYAFELQKVKAHIALHQVYGVDLNGTAVELAEISLWLDTMVAGLQAPWFGLHLRRGNSLIGARRAIYSAEQLTKKAWLTTPPTALQLGTDISTGGVHHFLMPAQGWGAVVDTAEAVSYAPGKRDELRQWRVGIRGDPSPAIRKRLANLALRVEVLWEATLRRLTIAESEIRRSLDLWGSEPTAHQPGVTREQIERVLHDEGSSYRRLRRVMDAWCSLWSWPLTTPIEPPGWDEWAGGLEALLGVPPKVKLNEKLGQLNAFTNLNWFELDDAEINDLLLTGARSIDSAKISYPWIDVAEAIAIHEGFFHWELDFAPIFERGGFDLQVGNPPWVRPGWSEPIELAEFDPWWQLTSNAPEVTKQENKLQILSVESSLKVILDRRSNQIGLQAFVGSPIESPLLADSTPNLYRSFILRSWLSQSKTGVVGLLHPVNHFIDDSFFGLRKECYLRVRRHWEFRNQKKLFSEIGNTRPYCVDIYGPRLPGVNFMQASWLFHPDTVSGSLVHNGSGDPSGIKDIEGNWDVKPHADRIVKVDNSTLASWLKVTDQSGGEIFRAQTLSAPNRDVMRILAHVSAFPRPELVDFESSPGWSETTYRKKGFYAWRSGIATDWRDVILQGPQIGVANPLFQQPNPTAKSHRDYSTITLDAIGDDFKPRTNYQVTKPLPAFRAAYKSWGGVPSMDFVRVAWSEMTDPFTARSLQACLLPPGPTHVHAINSATIITSVESTVAMLGISHSLVADAMVKVMAVEHVTPDIWRLLPVVNHGVLRRCLALRTLRLNCLTAEYSSVWTNLFEEEWKGDHWCPGVGLDYEFRSPLADISSTWDHRTPLRTDSDRRQALIEIDAIVAVSLGLSSADLVFLYKSMFPVVRQIEERAVYDRRGRSVPPKLLPEYRRKSPEMTSDLVMDREIYKGPMVTLDRERDMELAHKHFTALVEEG